MPEVRLLVAIDDHHVDEVLDVDDETAAAWHAAGKVSLLEDEQKLTSQPGHYTDVTGRDDVTPLVPGASPGPQAEEEDKESPKHTKGKKHG